MFDQIHLVFYCFTLKQNALSTKLNFLATEILITTHNICFHAETKTKTFMCLPIYMEPCSSGICPLYKPWYDSVKNLHLQDIISGVKLPS